MCCVLRYVHTPCGGHNLWLKVRAFPLSCFLPRRRRPRCVVVVVVVVVAFLCRRCLLRCVAVEETKWTASNPEALARAEETANAFAGGLSRYERQLEQALAKGDTKTAAQLEESIKSLRALLGAVESTAADLSS